MSELKYTPGPWTQGWSKNGVDCVWLNGKTEPKSGMGNDEEWIDCVTEANARLIAAAPTMYGYIELRASNGCEEAKKIMEAVNASC